VIGASNSDQSVNGFGISGSDKSADLAHRGMVSRSQILDASWPALYQHIASFHWIAPVRTYLVFLSTSNMTPPKPPVENPIDIPFGAEVHVQVE
jgi:hypothetical protein